VTSDYWASNTTRSLAQLEVNKSLPLPGHISEPGTSLTSHTQELSKNRLHAISQQVTEGRCTLFGPYPYHAVVRTGRGCKTRMRCNKNRQKEYRDTIARHHCALHSSSNTGCRQIALISFMI